MQEEIDKRPERVFFGGTFLFRSWCEDCKRKSLVTSSMDLCCCGNKISTPSNFLQYRESGAEVSRSFISNDTRRDLLDWQDNTCIYCGSFIDTSCHVDHFVPWSYSGDNHQYNFFAACPECNHIKSDKIFDSVDGARSFIVKQRERRGLPTKTKSEICRKIYHGSAFSKSYAFPPDLPDRIIQMKKCMKSILEARRFDKWGRPPSLIDPESFLGAYVKLKSIRRVSEQCGVSRSLIWRIVRSLMDGKCRFSNCRIHCRPATKGKQVYSICRPREGTYIYYFDANEDKNPALVNRVHEDYHYVDLVYVSNSKVVAEEKVPHRVIRKRLLKDCEGRYWVSPWSNIKKEN